MLERTRLGKFLLLIFSKGNQIERKEDANTSSFLFCTFACMKKFVDVIVPLPIASQYTYSLPSDMEERVQEGCRVVVSFGRKKFYTAIVTKVHDTAPEGYETKDIEEVLDKCILLNTYLGHYFRPLEYFNDFYLYFRANLLTNSL